MVAVSNLLESLAFFSWIGVQFIKASLTNSLNSWRGAFVMLGSNSLTLESMDRESWVHHPPLFSSDTSLSNPSTLRGTRSSAFACFFHLSSKALIKWIASGPRTALWMSCQGWRGPCAGFVLKHFLYWSPLCWLWRVRKSGCLTRQNIRTIIEVKVWRAKTDQVRVRLSKNTPVDCPIVLRLDQYLQ